MAQHELKFCHHLVALKRHYNRTDEIDLVPLQEQYKRHFSLMLCLSVFYVTGARISWHKRPEASQKRSLIIIINECVSGYVCACF